MGLRGEDADDSKLLTSLSGVIIGHGEGVPLHARSSGCNAEGASAAAQFVATCTPNTSFAPIRTAPNPLRASPGQ